MTCTFFIHSHHSFQSEPLVGKLPTKLASKCCTCHSNGLILKASFHWCRDKLDEELQEVDVVMGLVSINPRYSPRLIQEQAMTTPLDVMNTLVRTCNWLVYCSMCWACSPPGKLSVLVCGCRPAGHERQRWTLHCYKSNEPSRLNEQILCKQRA